MGDNCGLNDGRTRASFGQGIFPTPHSYRVCALRRLSHLLRLVIYYIYANRARRKEERVVSVRVKYAGCEDDHWAVDAQLCKLRHTWAAALAKLSFLQALSYVGRASSVFLVVCGKIKIFTTDVFVLSRTGLHKRR